jgi:hypothetical protein
MGEALLATVWVWLFTGPFFAGVWARRLWVAVPAACLWPLAWLIAGVPADDGTTEGMGVAGIEIFRPLSLTAVAILSVLLGIVVGRSFLGPPPRPRPCRRRRPAL